MACFRPRVGQVRGDGRLGFYDRPGDTGALRVGCGHCIGCKLDRASAWSIRCQHEASLWEENSFVTLTYDDDHVPVVGGRETLCYPDVQLFLKRLRKASSAPVRFFAAGEYGSLNGRPHYHLLLFNRDFRDRVPIGKSLYESAELSSLWKHGLASVGAVNAASASYVSKYALKKVYGRVESAEHYGGRAAEFVHMSRRPGIGASWYDQFSADVLPRDYVVVSGKKYRVPRYYQERFKYGGFSTVFGPLQEGVQRGVSNPEFDYVVEKREQESIARGSEARSFARLADSEVVTEARLTLFSERRL